MNHFHALYSLVTIPASGVIIYVRLYLLYGWSYIYIHIYVQYVASSRIYRQGNINDSNILTHFYNVKTLKTKKKLLKLPIPLQADLPMLSRRIFSFFFSLLPQIPDFGI